MQPDAERKLSLAILVVVVAAQGIVLWPELSIDRFSVSDSVAHFTLIQGMAHAGNPLDFWSPETLGFAVMRTYQPLAHLIVVAAWWALAKTVPLITILVWCEFLAVLLLPVSVFACARNLEFPPLTAAAVALLTPFVAGPELGRMGIDLRTWYYFGMYPQAVGTNLLLLTLGMGFQSIRKGGHLARTGLMLGLTCAAHWIYGWMGAWCFCLLPLLPDAAAPRIARIRRVVAIGLVALVVTIFEIWPLITDGPILNHSRVELPEKFDSYGAHTVLGWLLSGQLMDHDRLPAITLLVFGGLAVLLWRWRHSRKLAAGEKFILTGAAFWTVVFFGRPTWGRLMLLVGATRDLPLHRVIAVLQLFLLLMAAVGLAALWQSLSRRWRPWSAVTVTVVLLLPMVLDCAAFLSRHIKGGQLTVETVKQDGGNLDAAIGLVRQRGGRAYAGGPRNWGYSFKVGDAQFYSFLARAGVPVVSFYFNASSLASEFMLQFDDSQPAQFRLFNVRTVVMPGIYAPPGFLHPLATFGRYAVYDAPGTGYFDVVDVTGRVPANRDTFFDICDRWFHSDALARSRYLLLDFFGDAPALPPPPSAGSPGAVIGESQTGQVYEADFDAARPAFVLFRMSWHPLWKAYVDGRPVKTAMLSPGFLGVPVTMGRHHIRCSYEPGSAKILMAISGLLLAVVLMGLERRNTRGLQS